MSVFCTLAPSAWLSSHSVRHYCTRLYRRLELHSTRIVDREEAVFKIKVLNALQMRFGPSNYTSLTNNHSKRNPESKLKTSLEVLYKIYLPQEATLPLQEVELDGWFLIYWHRTENMYHISHARVWYKFCISFLYSWIDVLDSNQPFDWRGWNLRALKSKWNSEIWAGLASILSTAAGKQAACRFWQCGSPERGRLQSIKEFHIPFSPKHILPIDF